MRLPFFSPKENQDNRILLIDINSSAVNTLLVYSEDQTSVKITGVGKALLEPGDVRNGTIIDFDRVRDALENSVMEATEDQGADVNNVIFGVYGENALGTTTTARSARGKNGPFTQSELEAIDQVISDNAQINIRNEHLETTGIAEADLNVVTYSTIYNKVNGHNVRDISVVEGDTLEVAKYTAFTPTYHINTLEKLAKKTKLKIQAIVPEIFGLVKSINGPSDYIIVNMGSDFTEVGVVFGGGIVANKWLPIGAQHFTREIAQKMGLSLKEAEKMKKSYIYGKLTSSEGMLVHNCIEDTLDVWLSGLHLLFNEFKGVKTFASHIYFTGEGADLPDILDIITEEPWTKSIPFKSPPEFYKVKLENLSRIADSTGNADLAEFIMPASLSTMFLEIIND